MANELIELLIDGVKYAGFDRALYHPDIIDPQTGNPSIIKDNDGNELRQFYNRFGEEKLLPVNEIDALRYDPNGGVESQDA